MKYRVPLLILGTLVVLYAALSFSGTPPLDAVAGLIKGSFGSPSALSGTLKETAPLLLAGVAVLLALKAGLFNIGVEGQFLTGAMTCAVMALRIPGVFGLVIGCAAGACVGALWAAPAGYIKAYRNGHEVITTIMLNNAAAFITTALVAKNFRDPSQEAVTTATLPNKLPLALDGPIQLTYAIPIGIVGAIWLAWWLSKTVAGYELQAVGANPVAAEFAGIDRRKVTVRAMMLSGAVGGLAGALQVVAVEGRFYSEFSPGYGFDALGVAMLTGGHPLLLLPSALLFGALAKGSTAVQILGVPKGITNVLLGALILNAAALRARKGASSGD